MHDAATSTVLPAASPFTISAAAEMTEAHGVRFANRLEVGPGVSLRLCSSGLMRYKLFLRGFAAALYLEDPALRAAALTNIPKRLELSYFWAIPGKMFGQAGRGVLERSLSRADLDDLDDRLQKLDAAYRDVKPGDRYALTYLPGHGTELSLNGRSLVSVPGADFARAYFGIWLGDHPVDRSLRDQLLGDR